MKKLFVCLAAVGVLTGSAFAAGGDPSEAGIPTSPLRIWSTGVGGGILYPLNDDFKAECEDAALGKIIWTNSFDFTDHVSLFADVNWYVGNKGIVGLDLGLDYTILPYDRVKPFLGVGGGVDYFYEGDGDIGGTATGRVGVTLELTNTVDVKVRVPFNAVFAQKTYMGIGVDVCVLFYSSLRNVKSINY